MVRREVLRGDDDFMQIALHQLCDEVDFLEKVDVRGLKKREKNEYLTRRSIIITTTKVIIKAFLKEDHAYYIYEKHWLRKICISLVFCTFYDPMSTCTKAYS